VLALSDQVVAAVAPLWCPHRELLWPWPYGRRELWTAFGRILRRAGLPDDRHHKFHCLRRTCYTLVTIHGSSEVAAQQLGHRTDMSRFYLDRSQMLQRQAADVLPLLEIDSESPSAPNWSI
jgi:integrase